MITWCHVSLGLLMRYVDAYEGARRGKNVLSVAEYVRTAAVQLHRGVESPESPTIVEREGGMGFQVAMRRMPRRVAGRLASSALPKAHKDSSRSGAYWTSSCLFGCLFATYLF